MKAHSPGEEVALGIILATIPWPPGLLRSCWFGGTGPLPPTSKPQWSCHRTEWEMFGVQPKRICLASCINNQAFPAVSNISGNFLIQRTGRQWHFPTCYSQFLCITHQLFKKFLVSVVLQKTLDLKVNYKDKGIKKIFRNASVIFRSTCLDSLLLSVK